MLTSSVKEIENVVSLQLYKELTLRKRSYSGPHFPAFGLNSVRMWENVDQNNSEYGHFSRSVSHVDPLPS